MEVLTFWRRCGCRQPNTNSNEGQERPRDRRTPPVVIVPALARKQRPRSEGADHRGETPTVISEHALRSPAAGHTAAGPLWRRPLGWDRWTRLAMLAATVAVAVPALVAVATGSWTIPHADSWSFDKTALTFFRTGEFHLQGWGQMFLLGQVVSAAPLMAVFGANHGALSLYGAVAGVAVLLLGFAVARRIVGSGRGLAVLLSVSAFPAFGLLATSFMTDLPSMAAALLCLLVGGAAIRRVSLPLLGLTVAFGVLGFTMREQSVAGLF